mgnify:CR=1 FL=1
MKRVKSEGLWKSERLSVLETERLRDQETRRLKDLGIQKQLRKRRRTLRHRMLITFGNDAELPVKSLTAFGKKMLFFQVKDA